MRLSDETELAKAAPSRFSGEWMGRRLSLTGGRVVLGVYCAVFITALLIVHIHLRFEIHDMKMQQHALQTMHRHLERELSMLDRGVASHSNDIERLKDYAITNLHMVENDRAAELVVAPGLAEKYSAIAVAQATGNDETPDIASTRGSRNPFRRFASLAFALSTNNRH